MKDTMPALAKFNPIRVVCFDDLPDITAVLRIIIDNEPDMECVGEFRSANGLLGIVHDLDVRPDVPLVIVLDGVMPGANSFEAMRELSRVAPHVKTIIYSGHKNRAIIDESIECGACGYVCKSDEPEILVSAVRNVARGRTFFPREI